MHTYPLVWEPSDKSLLATTRQGQGQDGCDHVVF